MVLQSIYAMGLNSISSLKPQLSLLGDRAKRSGAGSRRLWPLHNIVPDVGLDYMAHVLNCGRYQHFHVLRDSCSLS